MTSDNKTTNLSLDCCVKDGDILITSGFFDAFTEYLQDKGIKDPFESLSNKEYSEYLESFCDQNNISKQDFIEFEQKLYESTLQAYRESEDARLARIQAKIAKTKNFKKKKRSRRKKVKGFGGNK